MSKYLVVRLHNAVLATAGYRPWSDVPPEGRKKIVQQLAKIGLSDTDWLKEFWWRLDGDDWSAANPRVRRR